MTEQHPLTDAKCREIANKVCFRWPLHVDQGEVLYGEDDLRAIADWQLEQVVDWLRDRLHFRLYLEPAEPLNHKIDVDYVIEDLQEAMRPTTTQENN